MKSGQNDTLVIIPAYNEEKNIPRVIQDLLSTRLPLDILVVDDGSTDRTAEVARSFNGAVKVISLPFNLGIGGAVQTGLKYADRKGYQYAVQFDGDGQHVASEIPRLLDPLKQGAVDMVIGSRFLGAGNYHAPVMRRIGIEIFRIVNSWLVGQKITDNTSGFRGFNSRAIRFLARYYPVDYPEPEAVVILGRNGFRIKEVPTEMRHRTFGESSINAMRAIYYMIKVLLAIFVNVFKTYKE